MRLNSQKRHMLRLDLLEPGDVVLSKGISLLSEGNLLLQGPNKDRRFSHAAIVVNQCKWMESLDDGVLFSHLRLDKVERHANEHWALHRVDRQTFEEISVFRHPGLGAAVGSGRWHHVELTLENQGHLYFGLEFPAPERLASASPFLRENFQLHKAALSAALLGLRLGILEKKWRPGLFCSELVATLFLALRDYVAPDLLLIHEARKPFEVSPSDLGDPSLTCLKEVGDVVIEEGTELDIADPPADWPRRIHFYDARIDRERDHWVVKALASNAALLSHLEKLASAFEVGALNQIVDSSAEGAASFQSQDVDGSTSSDKIQGRQRVIDKLWADFDERALAEGWDRNRRLMETVERRQAYNQVLYLELKASLANDA